MSRAASSTQLTLIDRLDLKRSSASATPAGTTVLVFQTGALLFRRDRDRRLMGRVRAMN
jgi:hypothetical protein